MPDQTEVRTARRTFHAWWIVPLALFVILAVSVLGPHFIRERILNRLAAHGAILGFDHDRTWWLPINQIPGLSDYGRVPVWMKIDGAFSRAQCTDILYGAIGLTSIREIDLSDAPIEDEDLKKLREWPEIERLSLSNTRVTNRCLSSVHSLPKLSTLSLSNTEIDDDGMAEIAQLSRLEHLELTGTKITDDGLKQLREMKSLKVLSLSNTQISESAVQELSTLLPNLQITDD